jgi:hypothetical protein
MLRCEFLDARHGDCFLVRWGAERVMLVDGGPDGTYENSLRPYLIALPMDAFGQRVMEAVCLTHVDDDHVIGVQRLLTELSRAVGEPAPTPLRIKRFWFNSVEELVEAQTPGLFAEVQSLLVAAPSDGAVGASINKGRDIRDRAAGLGLLGNAPFGGPLLQAGQAAIDGLMVTVVAPDQEAMDELSKKWKAAKRTADPAVIVSAYSDRSIPNLSSIVLFVEHEGHTALLTGDARGDRILAGLEASGLLTNNKPLHLDLLKLPHHGSNRNVERGFFERIHADHYVISADGVAHHHPHEEALTWLVESRQPNDAFTVHLTNEIEFAVTALEDLRRGRSFTVAVRPAEARALVVNLDA